MSAPKMLRPQRIAAMREAMAELERQRALMCDALRETNDETHQAFFADVLDRLGLIFANEREGITQFLAGDLLDAKSALRRLRLSDIDPDLDGPTRARHALRGARGNLVESIETALEAAQALDLHPRDADLGPLPIARGSVAEQLIRLDERLRITEEAVVDLREAARAADAAPHPAPVNQFSLVNVHVKALTVEVSAARFETRIGMSPQIPGDPDLAALTRAVGTMHEIGQDLKQATEALRDLMTPAVRNAGRAVARAAERSWRGIKTVVRWTRRKLAHPAQAATTDAEPPPDFDSEEARAMILAGKAPPPSWRPWIRELVFDGTDLSDLAPLAGLTALKWLDLDNTPVRDLAPLAGLTALKWLDLDNTPVGDLAPLVGLTALQTLWLQNTPVSDLSPLVGLTALRELRLSDTLVSNFAPLAGLSALETLRLDNTPVRDLSPLAGLSALEELWLRNTPVSDLAPLAGLSHLKAIYVEGSRRDELARTLGTRGHIVKYYESASPEDSVR